MLQNVFKVEVIFVFFILYFERSNASAGCDQFFYRNPWPMIANDKRTGLVKLCQTQLHSGREGKVVFATLYSTHARIPLYTANVVNINGPNKGPAVQNPGSLWKRVATALCDMNPLPQHPINSKIGKIGKKYRYKYCGPYQALTFDYKGSGFDRGHLAPNTTNSRDREKQTGTFTLTNAAPQYVSFNRGMWKTVEWITEETIVENFSYQDVYIMTGTFGISTKLNNRVAVPESFWKAVCYPGNSSYGPYGYAIIGLNANYASKYKLMNLRDFSNYFVNHNGPFHETCLNADMGPFLQKFCSKGFFLSNTYKNYIRPTTRIFRRREWCYGNEVYNAYVANDYISLKKGLHH